jgi:hypothetical protein
VFGVRRAAQVFGARQFGARNDRPGVTKTSENRTMEAHAWMCKSGIRYAQIVTAGGTAGA